MSDAITTALADAASDSSANSNGVATLDDAFADPDTDALRQKVYELLTALRR